MFHSSKNGDVFLILKFINFQGEKLVNKLQISKNRKADASTDANTFSEGFFWAVKFLLSSVNLIQWCSIVKDPTEIKNQTGAIYKS